MRSLDSIQKYHFFRFEKASPGIVKVKRLPKDSWTEVNLLKRNVPKQYLLFATITPTPLKDIGLLDEKRHVMWSKYGKYVPTYLRNNWLYRSPDSDLILRAQKTKTDRVQSSQITKQKRKIDSNENHLVADPSTKKQEGDL